MSKRKWLAGIIAAVMALAILPCGAFATETQKGADNAVAEVNGHYYTTLIEAVNSTYATEGCTINLLKDYTVETAEYTDYNMSKGSTLDLGTHTLTNAYMTALFQGENITIQNGTFESTASYSIWIGDGDETSATLINIKSNGGVNVFAASATLKDCEIDASEKGFYALWADQTGSITVESGKYTSGQTALSGTAKDTDDTGQTGLKGAIKVDGGSFVLNSNNKVVPDATRANVTIGGGSFTDLNALIAVSPYFADGIAAETTDGETFTVKPDADAAKESAASTNFKNGVTIYFSGENAEENAKNFIGGNSDDIEPVSRDKVKLEISYLDQNGKELTASTTRGLTKDEYASGKLTIDLTKFPTVTKAGYKFAAWQAQLDETKPNELTTITSDSLTTTFDTSMLLMPGTDGTVTIPAVFYASWTKIPLKNGVVEFDSNGGSAVESLELKTGAEDGTAILSCGMLSGKVPTREGYTFVGWEDVDKKLDGTQSNLWKNGVVFGGESDSTAAATFAVTEGDNVLKLKAVWKKNATAPSEDNDTNADANKTNGTTTTTTTKTVVNKVANALPATGDVAGIACAALALTGAAALAIAKRRNRTNA